MWPTLLAASTGLLVTAQLAATAFSSSNLDIDRRQAPDQQQQQQAREDHLHNNHHIEHQEPAIELIIDELRPKSNHLAEEHIWPLHQTATTATSTTITSNSTDGQPELELNATQTHQHPANATNVLELSAFEAAHLGLFRHSTRTSVILTIAYSLVFVIGIVGNSFVVAIVCKSPRMRTVTNYFIANLALADILVLLFCLPATLISNLFIPYVLGLFVCKTVSYLQGVAVSASINTMVTVTMDRFLAICFPMDWHMSRRTARWTIAGIWLFSLAISAPWALFFTLVPFPLDSSTYIQLCSEHWPSERSGNVYFIIANLILLYLLPACVIILCYLGIWYKIERRNIPGDRPKGLKIELIMQKSKLKVVKMMMVVVVIFLMSWLPVYLIVARIKLGSEERTPWEDWLITHMMPLAQWLGASNSCINPILYTFFNRKYKRDFIDLLRFAFCCNPKALRQEPPQNQRQLTSGGGPPTANGTGAHMALSAYTGWSSSSRAHRSAGGNQKRTHYIQARQHNNHHNNFSFNSTDNANNNNGNLDNNANRKRLDHNHSGDQQNCSSSGTATSNLRLTSSVLTLASAPSARTELEGRAMSMQTLHRPCTVQLIVAPTSTPGSGRNGRRSDNRRRRSVGLPPAGTSCERSRAGCGGQSINYVEDEARKPKQQPPLDQTTNTATSTTSARKQRHKKRHHIGEDTNQDDQQGNRHKSARRRTHRTGRITMRASNELDPINGSKCAENIQVAQVEQLTNKPRPPVAHTVGQQSNSSGSLRSSSKSSKRRPRDRPAAPTTSATVTASKTRTTGTIKEQTIRSNNTTDSTDTTAISLTTTTTTNTNNNNHCQLANAAASTLGNTKRPHNNVELENQSAGMTDNDEADELDQAESGEFRSFTGDLDSVDGGDDDDDDDDSDYDDHDEDDDDDEDHDEEQDLSDQSDSSERYSHDEPYVQDSDNLFSGSPDEFASKDLEMIGRRPHKSAQSQLAQIE